MVKNWCLASWLVRAELTIQLPGALLAMEGPLRAGLVSSFYVILLVTARFMLYMH